MLQRTLKKTLLPLLSGLALAVTSATLAASPSDASSGTASTPDAPTQPIQHFATLGFNGFKDTKACNDLSLKATDFAGLKLYLNLPQDEGNYHTSWSPLLTKVEGNIQMSNLPVFNKMGLSNMYGYYTPAAVQSSIVTSRGQGTNYPVAIYLSSPQPYEGYTGGLRLGQTSCVLLLKQIN